MQIGGMKKNEALRLTASGLHRSLPVPRISQVDKSIGVTKSICQVFFQVFNNFATPMIPLEKQVVSLELAKRLKELGVKQESYFVWAKFSDNPESWYIQPKDHQYPND
jgi:hypothetical protein